MSGNDAPSTKASFQVGPDLVTTEDTFVCIDAIREFPDWQVRGFARIPIYFQDQRYFLREKQAGKAPFAVRYILELWTDHSSSAPFSFDYNEETVAQRDVDHRDNRKNEAIGKMLYLVYPFLGLLWAGTKDKLVRFGFVPRTITGVSISTVFFAMTTEAIFAGRLRVGFIRLLIDRTTVPIFGLNIPTVFLDYVVVLVLLVDCIMRYDAYLRESAIEWGFFEWVKKPFLRGKTVRVGGEEMPLDAFSRPDLAEPKQASSGDGATSDRKVA